MKQITMHPIGVIHSPFKNTEGIPIQGIFNPHVEAWVELNEKYVKGLKDLDGFSHAILLYYFHKSQKEEIEGTPFLENRKHGIFAIRSPHRPNHIGFSIVKIKKIHHNKLYFSEVDMLDGTPVLDIKPYISYVDKRENAVAGWFETHIKNGIVNGKTIL